METRNLGFMGYPDYEVTTTGEVWSLKFGKRYRLSPGRTTRYGHLKCCLCVEGRVDSKFVHRLVMEAFRHIPDAALDRLGIERKDLVLDHIDHNPSNNDVSNLRWATNRANCSHRKKKPVSGFTGTVYMYNRSHLDTPWLAQAYIDGKNRNLGYYATSEEASAVYQAAVAEDEARRGHDKHIIEELNRIAVLNHYYWIDHDESTTPEDSRCGLRNERAPRRARPATPPDVRSPRSGEGSGLPA